jgi:ABC-type glycerol-3-phosphate transport system substrate-binding protein
MSARSAISKVMAALIAIVVLVALIGGIYYYYSSTTPTSKKIELTIANISYQSDWYQAKIEEWNDKYPNIHVTYKPLADYYTEIVSTLTSNPGAVDIVRTNPGYLIPWVEAGWITNIDGLDGFNEILSQVDPSRRFELYYNGKYWGLPSQTGYIAILLYNKQILKEAGIDHPPATLDELVQQCLTIKNKGIMDFPLAWHLKGSERRIDWAWYEFAIMKGGKTLYDENWNPTYLQPGSPGYDSLKFIIDCIYEYKIMDQAALEWDTFKVVDMLMKRQCAFAPGDPFYFASINDPTVSPEAGNITIALMPGSHYTWVKTDIHSITKACRDKGKEYFEAAWEVLKFLCGPEKDCITYMHASAGLTLYSCYSSINNDSAIQAVWFKYYNVSIVNRQVTYAINLQNFSPAHRTKFYLSWVNDYLIPNLQAAILQQKSIGDALLAIDYGFKTLASQYGLPSRT